MGIEIERKFLVNTEHPDFSDVLLMPCSTIEQGYIFDTDNGVLRVRIEDDTAFLTLKSRTIGISRQEYEYKIPFKEGFTLLKQCKKTLAKLRYNYYTGDNTLIQVDSFVNIPLVLAEIELEHPNQPFISPPWLGLEVSHLPEYYNSNLIKGL